MGIGNGKLNTVKIDPFNSLIVDWTSVQKQVFAGESGTATWQVQMLHDIRVRLVEFSSGYKADHLCDKGHVIYCLDGKMEVGLPGNKTLELSKGMTYLIGDNTEPHLALSENGCKLFIVD